MNRSGSNVKLPPPWEVLLLVTHHLDPKTLAAASCVCKSWSLAMSSDTIWKPICDAHYQSLYVLRSIDSTLSFRHLFAIAAAASKLRRRVPPKPRLTLTGLVFVVEISTPEHCSIATMVKAGSELRPDRNGLFQFEMETSNGGEFVVPVDVMDSNVRVTWHVAVRGWSAGFTMVEKFGILGFLAGVGGVQWLSEQLPPPGCCSFVGAEDSGVVAEVKLVVRGSREDERKVKVESAVVGMMNRVSWRYLAVDDALRYLQHFLVAPAGGVD